MLYKVIIVDDEPLIREGLRTLVPWESYDFNVVDIAKNGKDALEKYELHKPDLMVVDIRMPGMDGLELIETIRKKDSALHFLILSGYADFEYAKRAIVCSVDGYIVKPVDEDELSSYLEKVQRALKKELEVKHTAALETEWRHDHLVQYLLSHEKGKADPEFKRKLEQSGLLWESYQPVILQWYAEQDVAEETHNSIKESLAHAFSMDGRGIVFSRENQIAILLRAPIRNEQASHQLYDELSRLVLQHDIGFYAALGEAVKNYMEISKSYDHTIELLKKHFLFKEGRWITQEGYPLHRSHKGQGKTIFDQQASVDKLYYAMDIGNKDAIEKALTDALNDMIAEEQTENTIKTNCIQLLTAVFQKLSFSHPDYKPAIQEASQKIVNIYNKRNIYELLELLGELVSSIVARLTSKNNDTILKQMVELIHRNYNENLKLETLSETFNYNSAYLGKLFKNYTGEYFNTYLDKVRIDKAKELLQQDLKVYQVAERIGYTNVDYFHSKFKKYVGISPSAYRREQS